MRKLRLNPDDLRVDTFTADGRTGGAGTVHGNMPFKLPATDETGGGGSGGDTGYHTCDCTIRKTCQNTCGIDFCTESCVTGPINC